MSDNLIARAKAAMEGINDGPWLLHNERGHYGVTNITEPHAFGNIVFAQSDYAGYGNGSRKADAEFIAAARTLVPELVAEVERLHSWDGLISLVDEHYPADIFPTEPDRDTRDPGPRIISLLRVCDELRSARPMHPVYDDLAAERLDGIRDERDELLVRVDELTEELAVFRRQQPDDDAAKVRRVQ